MAIRAKLVIIIFVFAILPMFLLWARWQGTALGNIKSVLRHDLTNRTQEISGQLDLTLKNYRARLAELAGQPLLKSYARALAANNRALPDATLRVELSAFLLTQHQQYAALVGVNQHSATLFKIEAKPGANNIVRPFFQDKEFAQEDLVKLPTTLFTTTDTNTLHVSEVAYGSSGPFVWLFTPLRDEAGVAYGALAAKLRTAQLLAEAAGPRGASITSNPEQARTSWRETLVVSPEGTVLYAADPAKQGKPYQEAFADFEPALTSLLRGEKPSFADKSWLIAQSPHTTAPQLSILALENYSEAATALEYDSIVMLLLTAAVAAVATLCLFYLISTITDSIRRVTTGARAIASGDLNHQIKVRSNDETRVLAHAFNRMAAKLREMIRKEGEQKQFESFARLSAVLTHDLKNQILSLSLLVNNMEKKFHRDGFKEDAMRTLSETVTNLNNLVAKLSDPRTPTKRVREDSNLTHLVERVLQRTATQAAGKYSLTSRLTPNVNAIVDGKAVERVVENLVINAMEAMPNGGTLCVLTSIENGQAVISVADTGKGMTEEFIRTRLFHPFATTKKKGIGLGLYSCRDTIEQHGGRIDVTSQVEIGTEFRVVLPLNVEESKPVLEKQAVAV